MNCTACCHWNFGSSKFIQNYYFHVQLSLLRDTFCVIYVDNKTQSGLQLHNIQLNLHIPKTLEVGLNNVKILEINLRVLIHVVSQQFLLKLVQNKTFRFYRFSKALILKFSSQIK